MAKKKALKKVEEKYEVSFVFQGSMDDYDTYIMTLDQTSELNDALEDGKRFFMYVTDDGVEWYLNLDNVARFMITKIDE